MYISCRSFFGGKHINVYKSFSCYFMWRLIYLFITGFILSACSQNRKGLSDEFSKTVPLVLIDSINLEEHDILNPYDIRYKDDFLIFRNIRGEREIQLLDLKAGASYTHSVIGQGKGEMPAYVFMDTFEPHSFRFVDYYGGYVYEINLDRVRKDGIVRHTLVTTLPVKDEIRILGFEETPDYIYGTGLLPNNRFWVYDKRTKSVSKGTDYPSIEQANSLDSIKRSVLFVSTQMAVHKDRLVAMLVSSGLVDFYERSRDGSLSLIKEHCFFFPQFQVLNGISIGYSRDDIRGFSDMASDEDYVYLLYSSKTVAERGEDAYNCEDLYVYDWDGNPVCHYTLPQPLYSISVGKGCLYGLSRTGEPKVYTYSLKR